MACKLLRAGGLFLVQPAAIIVAGAVKRTRERGLGQVKTTTLWTVSGWYASKLYNAPCLGQHGLAPKSQGPEFLAARQGATFTPQKNLQPV